VLAVALACASALLFGAMTVVLRFGLRRTPNAELGTLVTVAAALVVALAATGVDAAGHGLAFRPLWPFFLTGALAPGVSQILFTFAVREAGPSRTSVVVGSAPLVSVAVALVALHEPLRAPLLAGAVLIVLGGATLVYEGDRPGHVRLLGLGLAFGTTVLFATRDNIVRSLAGGTSARPTAAAAAALLMGALVAAALPGVRRGAAGAALRPFVLAGFLYGLSYVSLYEAFYRGRVTVVSPLVATESLWGVGLSLLLLRASDHVRPRVVLGAALVVTGGALIGVFR
jgi:drug/metabolite transporter (DMT)-like permease